MKAKILEIYLSKTCNTVDVEVDGERVNIPFSDDLDKSVKNYLYSIRNKDLQVDGQTIMAKKRAEVELTAQEIIDREAKEKKQ